MKKGFIGPIGDDLPAMIAVMLALGLFFSAMLVTLNMYNQKITTLQLLNGGMDASRAILAAPYFSDCSPSSIRDFSFILASYGIRADVSLDAWDPASTNYNRLCSTQAEQQCAPDRAGGFVSFSYFVGIRTQSGINPGKLTVSVCK
ncbi:hypothetical protein HYS54_04240 [Candidatus Micrarchaeota archaeon]|nr:hypothetical protein [Candidatus Micrarchaeota archaeon]